MDKSNIKNIIRDYVYENDMTSFVEIERIFDKHGFDFKGDLSMRSSVKSQAVFWDGWNDDAITLIHELMADRTIIMDVCQPITYLIDGGGLNLPIPKSSNFKKPHWIPVAFSTTGAGC